MPYRRGARDPRRSDRTSRHKPDVTSSGPSETPHDLALKAEHSPESAVTTQAQGAPLSRLEAPRRPRRNVQPIAAGGVPIEPQARIGFEKMVVRADLNGPVARVLDVHLER